MFRIARDAARLTSADRARAVRASGWLALARLLLASLPYPAVRAALERVPGRVRRAGSITPSQAADAIRRASRVLPASSCLARAIAAAALLRRDGIASALTLEVAVDPSGTLHAHAVLHADGVVVTGGDARLDDLNGAAIARDRIAAAQ